MPEPLPTLGYDVREYIDAGYPALWVHSYEQEDGIEEIRAAIAGEDYPIFVRWDGAAGMKRWVEMDDKAGWAPVEGAIEFAKALQMLQAMSVEEADSGGEPARACAVFLNLQLHVTNAIRAQELLNYIHAAETRLRQRLVTLSTTPSPPEILQPFFTKLTHKLPNRDQLRSLLETVAVEDGDLPEESEEVEAILDAAKGMTRSQARNAFSLCLVRQPHRVEARPVFELKAAGVVEHGLGLALHQDQSTTLADVVGLNHVKSYYLEVMANREALRHNPRLRPRGIILAGLPGCLAGDTEIYDPVDATYQTVGERHVRGEAFHVVALTADEQLVVADADAPIRYPAADMLRFTYRSGRQITVTAGHHFYAGGGAYVAASVVASRLREFGPFRLPTIWELGRQVRALGARRWLRTAPDYPARCSACSCLCGARLRSATDADPATAPSQADARQHSRAWWHADVPGGGGSDIRPELSLRHSTPDFRHLPEKHTTGGYGSCALAESAQRDSASIRGVVPLLTASVRYGTAGWPFGLVSASRHSSRPSAISLPCEDAWPPPRGVFGSDGRWHDYPNLFDGGRKTPLVHSAEPCLCGAACETSCGRYIRHDNDYAEIVQVEELAAAAYYDFHVPYYHNYWAIGSWHHNTGKSLLCAALGNSTTPSRMTLKWRKALTGSKWVGEGAEKMDKALSIMEALAPVNVMVDEGGKAMKASVGGEGGSSVQAGEMDSLWLERHQESQSDIYPIFTMNQEIIELADRMPEFLDRFDAVFFLDYPTPEQIDQLWVYHLKLYGLIKEDEEYLEMKQKGAIPDCKNWVGRTVDNCARQAALRKRAPIEVIVSGKSKLIPESIDRMRRAATDNGWLSAEYPEAYDKDKHWQRMEAIPLSRRDTVRPKKKIKRA